MQLIERVISERDHPRQAPVGGWRRWRWSCSRSIPPVAGAKELDRLVGEIRETMADDLAGSELTAQLSGVPVMQLEIRNAVERDRLIYNAIGFVAGCLIAILFFRRVSFMIIAAGAAADRDPARARRARLARFPPQHVPERDDAADHGDQLLRLHAAHLRGARPADRGREQIPRRSATPSWSSGRPAC